MPVIVEDLKDGGLFEDNILFRHLKNQLTI